MVGVIWIVALVLVTFTAAYIGYGRYLAQFVGLDDSRETPAHKYQDGQEYVPAVARTGTDRRYRKSTVL